MNEVNPTINHPVSHQPGGRFTSSHCLVNLHSGWCHYIISHYYPTWVWVKIRYLEILQLAPSNEQNLVHYVSNSHPAQITKLSGSILELIPKITFLILNSPRNSLPSHSALMGSASTCGSAVCSTVARKRCNSAQLPGQ